MKKLASLAVLVLAAACGSGNGTVTLLLTDAPSDLAGVTAIKVTLAAIQVHLADKGEAKNGDPADTSIDSDSKWTTLTPSTKTFDLMTLTNDATAALGSLELPEGKITQVRLLLDTSKPENNTVALGTTICNLDTSKVDVKGIKINHPFKALEVNKDGTVEATIDFVASDSITKGSAACDYRLEPVIKIKKVKVDGKDFAF